MVAVQTMSSPTLSQRRDVTAALLALAATVGLGCSRNRDRAMDKRTAKLGHDTWVLWPDGSPPPGGWPVLLFLHGQGEAAWVDDGRDGTEQGPDAVLAHHSPAALHKQRDARVPTLWQNFVLIAPQAFNDKGVIRWWRWWDDSVKQRVAADVERVLKSGKVDVERVCATGFSRGGQGCYGLDSASGPLQFKRIATVEAQDLEALPAVVARKRQVRVYYSPNTYSDIAKSHATAAKVQAGVPSVSFIKRAQQGKDDAVHVAMCERIYVEDELYRWLLG
jgi:poly(3-hydroxybutyrate) depolymerase